jgi:shikimate 5-dehydrogenase
MKQDKDDNVIAPHSNAIMPHLHEHHQLARVLYSVANLDIEREQYHPYFD